jgi:uncharacterized protein HemX
MIATDDTSSELQGDTRMKKLLATALGLGLALGTYSFAQQSGTSSSDTSSGTTKGKKHKKGKKNSSSSDTSGQSTTK